MGVSKSCTDEAVVDRAADRRQLVALCVVGVWVGVLGRESTSCCGRGMVCW